MSLSKRQIWVGCLPMWIATIMLFANTIDHEYAWDDRIVITENPYVLSGFDGLSKIWEKQHSDYLHDKVGYRPITLTTFALEQEFAPGNPKIGHVLNVFLYGLLVVSILLFLEFTLEVENWMLAFLITLLFAVHPLHVEVVANIKSRDEILQMLFGIWSVFCFKNWLDTKRKQMVIGSVLLVSMAVLSKENGIAWVGVMALVWIVRSSEFSINIRSTMPGLIVLIAGAVAFGLIAFGLSGDEGSELTEGLDIFYESPILGDCFRQTNDSLVLLTNKNLLIFRYIGKFILPLNLTYYSGFDQIPLHDSYSLISVFGLVGTIGLIAVIIFSWFKQRQVFLGLSIFLVLISPYLHVLRPMPDTIGDRFMFSASLGLCVVLVLGIELALKKVIGNQKNILAQLLFVGLLVVCFAVLTHERNKVWKDNLTLFKTDLPKLDNCAKAHEFYADALHVKLDETRNVKLIPEIIEHYERSIEISELSYYSFIKLGSNYAQWGNAQRGLELLARSVELFPEQSDPYFYYGNSLFQQFDFSEAVTNFQKARELSPKVYDSYYLESRCHLELGSPEQANAVAQLGLKNFPNQIMFKDVIADAFLLQGDTIRAIEVVDEITRGRPNAVQFWKKSIGLRQLQGRMSEADSLFQIAIGLGVDFR